MKSIEIYETKFTKKNGESRVIRFIKPGDLDDRFLSSKVTGVGQTKDPLIYQVVWDIESNAFRTITIATVDPVVHNIAVGRANYDSVINQYQYALIDEVSKKHDQMVTEFYKTNDVKNTIVDQTLFWRARDPNAQISCNASPDIEVAIHETNWLSEQCPQDFDTY